MHPSRVMTYLLARCLGNSGPSLVERITLCSCPLSKSFQNCQTDHQVKAGQGDTREGKARQGKALHRRRCQEKRWDMSYRKQGGAIEAAHHITPTTTHSPVSTGTSIKLVSLSNKQLSPSLLENHKTRPKQRTCIICEALSAVCKTAQLNASRRRKNVLNASRDKEMQGAYHSVWGGQPAM